MPDLIAAVSFAVHKPSVGEDYRGLFKACIGIGHEDVLEGYLSSEQVSLKVNGVEVCERGGIDREPALHQKSGCFRDDVDLETS